MAELFELDEQPVCGLGLARDAHHGAFLVRELGPLVEDKRAVDLSTGDKKELLVLIGGQLAETFMEKQRAHHVAPTRLCLTSFLCQAIQCRDKLIRAFDVL